MKKEHILEVQRALQNITQGCISLNRVLTAIQRPEAKNDAEPRSPEGSEGLHDAHVRAWQAQQQHASKGGTAK